MDHHQHRPDDDLADVEHLLREHRAEPSALELDELEQRIHRRRPARRHGTARSRLATMALTIGLTLSMSAAVVIAATTVTSTTSTSTSSPQSASVVTYSAACPTGTGVNFRWHYAGGSGSWSGTKTQICASSFAMGPQAMEGDLKLDPGATIRAGYDFTIPGNNSTKNVTVSNAKLTLTVRCVSGAAPSQSTLVINMGSAPYVVPDSKWYPSGDQKSTLVYQGSVVVPNACAGGKVRFDTGGTFTATVS